MSPWVTGQSNGEDRVKHGSGDIIFMENAVHPFLRKYIGGVCDGRSCWCTNLYMKAIINNHTLNLSKQIPCSLTICHYFTGYIIYSCS